MSTSRSSAPSVPAQVLRALAEQAGVHLYIDSYDALWATRGVIALSVDQAGPRTVRLPVAANATDLYDGKAVGVGIREFTADMPATESKVWRIDPVKP